MKLNDIISFGPVTIDYIGTANKLNNNESATLLQQLVHSYGGRGANFCVFSCILGTQPLLIAPVGQDYEVSDHQRHLRSFGVNDSGLLVASGLTPRAFVFSDESESRTYFFEDTSDQHLMDFAVWTESVVASTPHELIYCTSGIQHLNQLCLELSKADLKAYAPGHEIMYHSVESLNTCFKSTDVLLVNEHEAQVFEQRAMKSIESAANEFDIEIVVITLGSQGSLLITNGQQIHIAPCRPKVEVDSTGAGDAFAAGFLTTFLRLKDPLLAAQFGNAVASFAVESLGCQSSLPTKERILERVSSNYGFSPDI